ncbi:MAG: hypothetical protein IT562_14000 [Alphaproteobacteria bacterium]|nr:hypothetical protein [Alphaproteobacteria bacterium]
MTPIEAAGALAVMNLLQESQSAHALRAPDDPPVGRSPDATDAAPERPQPAPEEGPPLMLQALAERTAPGPDARAEGEGDRALDLARAFWSGSEPQLAARSPAPALTIERDEQGTATLHHVEHADLPAEAAGREVVVSPAVAVKSAATRRTRSRLGIAAAAAAAVVCAVAAAWTLSIWTLSMPTPQVSAFDMPAAKPVPAPAPAAQPQIVPPAPPPLAAARAAQPAPAAPPAAAALPEPAVPSSPPAAAKAAPRETVAAPRPPKEPEAAPAVAGPPRENAGPSAPPPRATREDIVAARPAPPIVPDRAPPLVDSGAVIQRAALPAAPAAAPQVAKPIILPDRADPEGMAAVAVVHLPAPAHAVLKAEVPVAPVPQPSRVEPAQPPLAPVAPVATAPAVVAAIVAPPAPLAAPAPAERAQIDPSASPAAPAAAVAAPPASGPVIDPAQSEAMLRRADALAAIGDLSAARLFYEKLALAGSRPAALALARSFDPDWLRLHGVMGVPADPERAAYWYTRAGMPADPRKPDLAQRPRS